jgi:hypothetical protein
MDLNVSFWTPNKERQSTDLVFDCYLTTYPSYHVGDVVYLTNGCC